MTDFQYTGYSWKQGKTSASAPFKNLHSKKVVELPKGTFLRVYKGSPRKAMAAGGFPQSPTKAGSTTLWRVETAPVGSEAWLAYTEGAGLPSSYAATWDSKNVNSSGWKRLYTLQLPAQQPMDAHGFPTVFQGVPIGSGGGSGSGSQGGSQNKSDSGSQGDSGSGSGGKKSAFPWLIVLGAGVAAAGQVPLGLGIAAAGAFMSGRKKS
jgi:hypothetical protein